MILIGYRFDWASIMLNTTFRIHSVGVIPTDSSTNFRGRWRRSSTSRSTLYVKYLPINYFHVRELDTYCWSWTYFYAQKFIPFARVKQRGKIQDLKNIHQESQRQSIVPSTLCVLLLCKSPRVCSFMVLCHPLAAFWSHFIYTTTLQLAV